MPRHVYIGSAWPYVNGRLHLGHVAGLLPADVLARYHRLVGDQVLWTSGSDCHGTPITEQARLQGCTPREIAERYHACMVEDFEALGFSYSLYWATMEPAHQRRVHESFLELHRQGLIVEGDYHMARCAVCDETRADREINGTCPKCQTAGARGDQCDACGEELNPIELIAPLCAKCQGAISFETSRELYFDLPQVADRLLTWVNQQTHWRENAKAWTEGWLKQGLKQRAITRKIDWGITVPLPGWEDRRIYVWFEAVHGYLTASMEVAAHSEDPEAWKTFWMPASDVVAYYVIGKDNIPFHSLLWPAVLMARGLALPWHIVSSEYLVFEDKKLSKSKGWVLYVHDFLLRYDPDLLRYFLIANGPETQDTNFTWERFVTLTNRELVDNYSNLVHRALSFARARFEGRVPPLFERTLEDTALLDLVAVTFQKVGAYIEQTELRHAIEAVMSLVQAANRYISEQAPWTLIKTDPDRASTVINTVLQVIASLSVLTEPFLPKQASRLRAMLNQSEGFAWKPLEVPEGTTLGEIIPLFSRLDPRVIEQERERLNTQGSAPAQT